MALQVQWLLSFNPMVDMDSPIHDLVFICLLPKISAMPHANLSVWPLQFEVCMFLAFRN